MSDPQEREFGRGYRAVMDNLTTRVWHNPDPAYALRYMDATRQVAEQDRIFDAALIRHLSETQGWNFPDTLYGAYGHVYRFTLDTGWQIASLGTDHAPGTARSTGPLYTGDIVGVHAFAGPLHRHLSPYWGVVQTDDDPHMVIFPGSGDDDQHAIPAKHLFRSRPQPGKPGLTDWQAVETANRYIRAGQPGSHHRSEHIPLDNAIYAAREANMQAEMQEKASEDRELRALAQDSRENTLASARNATNYTNIRAHAALTRQIAAQGEAIVKLSAITDRITTALYRAGVIDGETYRLMGGEIRSVVGIVPTAAGAAVANRRGVDTSGMGQDEAFAALYGLTMEEAAQDMIRPAGDRERDQDVAIATVAQVLRELMDEITEDNDVAFMRKHREWDKKMLEALRPMMAHSQDAPRTQNEGPSGDETDEMASGDVETF